MRNKLYLLVFLFASYEMASAQISLPAPSPAGKVYTKVGLTDVDISYSRPKAKGRKIYGSGDAFLVPFGQIWRTGANSGSIITTSTDLTVGGSNLPAGEYMIITIPNADSWDVIFYKDISIGGNMAKHKQENEQIRVKGNVSKLTEPVEALTFNIADLSADGSTAALELAWENTSVKVELKTDFDSVVMKQIEDNTKVNPGNYLASANYYFSTGRDLDQAIKWMDLYLAENSTQYWNLYLKAQMLAKKGDKKSIKEAIATAEDSLAKAKAAKNNTYVKNNEALIAELSKK